MTRSMRDRIALLADRWPTGVAAGNQAGGSGRRGRRGRVQFFHIKVSNQIQACGFGSGGRRAGPLERAWVWPDIGRTSYGTTAARAHAVTALAETREPYGLTEHRASM